MKSISPIFLIFFALSLVSSCTHQNPEKVRVMVDSTGFATTSSQMDSIVERIDRHQGFLLDSLEQSGKIQPWKTVICPHDDYAYAGYLYPAALSRIDTRLVILLGVAHKARDYDLQDRIVFGDYDYWQTPGGKVRVSKLREEVLTLLPENTFTVHAEMQQIEHSLEPIVSFLQRNNPQVEILPVLIPYMSFDQMKTHADALTEALSQLMIKRHLKWGKSLSIVISSDAVHYGDQGWGGKNFAEYGADTAGYKKATAHDRNLIDSYLCGPLSEAKIGQFFYATVQKAKHKEYKWTWCGRYSIPFGLLTSVYLARKQGEPVPSGYFVDYSSSITHEPLPVRDINMGHTAPANIHHWVGYATIGYK